MYLGKHSLASARRTVKHHVAKEETVALHILRRYRDVTNTRLQLRLIMRQSTQGTVQILQRKRKWLKIYVIPTAYTEHDAFKNVSRSSEEDFGGLEKKQKPIAASRVRTYAGESHQISSLTP